MTYHNEFDPFAAQWLHNLIAAGELPEGRVDVRSIVDVRAGDLEGVVEAHFFAGIGGWPLALRMAGWPAGRQCWSASLPCQPFSTAGKLKGKEDERHLWPVFCKLVGECLPATIFGEQVASVDGVEWLCGVRSDLEALGYAVGAANLCAAGVGAAHIRQRLFWVATRTVGVGQANTDGPRHVRQRQAVGGSGRSQADQPEGRGRMGSGVGLAHTAGARRQGGGPEDAARGGEQSAERGGAIGVGLADTDSQRVAEDAQGREPTAERRGAAGSACGVALGDTARTQRGQVRRSAGEVEAKGRVLQPDGPDSVVWCRDGKWRRLGPGIEPVAHAVPAKLGPEQSELERLGRRARKNHRGRLRGYGNAILPTVAAAFIRAFLEAGY